MDDFVSLSPEERRIFLEGTATARNVQAQIMEKDFWVCWTLKEMFFGEPPGFEEMLALLKRWESEFNRL